MIRITFLSCALAQALLLPACMSCGAAQEIIETKPCVRVSDVIMNPTEFDGKTARYCGYFRDDYPIMSVYGDAEGAYSGEFMRQITWRYDTCIVVSGAQALQELTGTDILVDAKFTQTEYEASGLALGGFTDVSAIWIGGKLLTCEDYQIGLEPHLVP